MAQFLFTFFPLLPPYNFSFASPYWMWRWPLTPDSRPCMGHPFRRKGFHRCRLSAARHHSISCHFFADVLLNFQVQESNVSFLPNLVDLPSSQSAPSLHPHSSPRTCIYCFFGGPLPVASKTRRYHLCLIVFLPYSIFHTFPHTHSHSLILSCSLFKWRKMQWPRI